MTGRAILALAWGGRLSALRQYVSETQATVITMSDCCGEDVRALLENAGGKVIFLNDMLSQEDTPRIRLLAHAKSDDLLRVLKADVLAREAKEWNVDSQAAMSWLEGIATPYQEEMLALVEQLEMARSQYAIDLTLLCEEWTSYGRLALRWSKLNNIPVLHLTHGTGLSRYYTVHSTLEADKYAVFGERGMESLLDESVSRERIVITGNPAWDFYSKLAASRNNIRAELCRKHDLDTSKPVIVFATTWNACLSAHDQRSYVRDIQNVLKAFSRLETLDCYGAQLVLKDRVSIGNEQKLFQQALADAKIHPSQVVYTVTDAIDWVVAADVVVSVDSNMAVEAVLAGTIAVNLIDETGLLFGPSFAADGAIVETMPDSLAEVLSSLLHNNELRSQCYESMRRKAPIYNIGIDGQSMARLTGLMKSMGLSSSIVAPDEAPPYVWQNLLNVDDTDATQYHNWPRSELVDMAPRPPRCVLDIGCAAGKTGEYIKQKFPQAKVYGVEVNRAAASLATERLDSVFCGRFEDFDFAEHGISLGSLDTVIVADVLEHIYDPWGVLVRLKPYLTADAQVLASIPNTRNLAVMNDLAEGNWRYEAWGLLDVTHIRFFTLKEMRRFFHETGYHVVDVKYQLDVRLGNLYKEHQGKSLFNLEFDKFTLKNVTQEEMAELCALQAYLVAEPGAIDNKAFAELEKKHVPDDEPRLVYDLWREARQLTKAQGDLYEQRMATWAARPRFHLAIINPLETDRLTATIQSLSTQYYHDLQLSVIAPSTPPEGWSDSSSLSWHSASVDGLLEKANQVLCESGADWVGVIDAGDTVAAHSLLFLAEAINVHPDWRYIYSDEDVLLSNGRLESPQFKPDFNLDLMRSLPYVGGLAMVNKDVFRNVGGFSSDMVGAEEHDLALRTYELIGAKAMGHLPDVFYHRLKDGGRWRLSAAELVETGKRSVERHLLRTGVKGAVEHGLFPASYRVRYEHAAQPRVSILIAVRDQIDKFRRCIESVLSTTHYPDYEILVIDNGSTFSETREYLEGLEALEDERIRVYSYPAAANLSLMHNMLANEATGEYLLFLHFDAAVLRNDWLGSMMAHALRPEVGMVAPRMLRADGTLAQTGLVLGLDATVDSPFRGEPISQQGYFGRAHLEQDCSALGGGCLLIRKAVFDSAGGFDVENFGTDFAETDFSLRLKERGFLAVWTPFVSILCEGVAPHHAWSEAPVDECTVQALHDEEVDHLYERYLPQLAGDTTYNVNLSLSKGEFFEVESCSPLCWDPLPWRPLPRVLARPADNQGCGEYRMLSPMRALVEAGKVQGWSEFRLLSMPEMERINADAIVFQRQIDPDQIAAMAKLKKFSHAFRVYELDDLLINLPLKSAHRVHMPQDVVDRLRQGLALCDRFIVSTEPLKEAYRYLHSDIRVVPNCIERARWEGFKPLRRQSTKPRVGWAGGIGHSGDLEMIADVVKTLSDKVDWVFMCLCPEDLRPWIKEFHPGVPLGRYPSKLASLNLDLAIAPLEQNPFNDSKSHLRLLEYGVLGYPVVCSDVFPYKGDAPVTRVRNRHKDWVEAILEQLADLDQCAKQGDLLRDYVEKHWMLEDNLDMWMQAWLP